MVIAKQWEFQEKCSGYNERTTMFSWDPIERRGLTSEKIRKFFVGLYDEKLVNIGCLHTNVDFDAQSMRSSSFLEAPSYSTVALYYFSIILKYLIFFGLPIWIVFLLFNWVRKAKS
tara:strand:+ start:1629 stop:1976 length:348 start_codon:yes stop_codon:yes gene_type:complete